MGKRSTRTSASSDELYIPSDIRWVWVAVVVLGGVVAYNFTLEKEKRYLKVASDFWFDWLKSDPDQVVRTARLAHRLGLKPEHYTKHLIF